MSSAAPKSPGKNKAAPSGISTSTTTVTTNFAPAKSTGVPEFLPEPIEPSNLNYPSLDITVPTAPSSASDVNQWKEYSKVLLNVCDQLRADLLRAKGNLMNVAAKYDELRLAAIKQVNLNYMKLCLEQGKG